MPAWSTPDEPTEERWPDALPPADYHLGGLAGYDAGRGARRLLAAVGVLGLVAGIAGYVWYANHVEYQRTHPFTLPADTDIDALPRTLHWSDGNARFALRRDAPGVEAIVLPDRTLRLADGVDRAQVFVYVHDGRARVEILSGAIHEEPRTP